METGIEGDNMLIGLDMDGVIADWDGYLDGQLDLVPELAEFPRQPHRGWNDYKTTAPEHKKLVYKILEHPEFYPNLPTMPGAVEAIKKMRADGHDIVFVSSPWVSNPMGFQAKADWLKRHVGSWARENLFLGGDKTLVIADVLVDDKPVIKGRLLEPDAPMPPVWERIYFDQPYNSMLPGPRILNWTDGSWEDVLYSLADAPRQDAR